MERSVPSGGARDLALARAAYAELGVTLGAAAVAAGRRLPAVLAEIDQHQADLRERLGRGEPPSLPSLAGYCAGLRETAARAGWRLPAPAVIDWPRAEWLTLRLAAACLMADDI